MFCCLQFLFAIGSLVRLGTLQLGYRRVGELGCSASRIAATSASECPVMIAISGTSKPNQLQQGA